MNSTLKSLLFWMALVVLGVLIWNFSTKFQSGSPRTVNFSEFMSWADSGGVARVTITGQEINGYTKVNEHFQVYAPAQYDGLVNKLIDRGVQVTAKEPTVRSRRSFLRKRLAKMRLLNFMLHLPRLHRARRLRQEHLFRDGV